MTVTRWLRRALLATVAATLLGCPYTGENFSCHDPDRLLGCPDAATPVDAGPSHDASSDTSDTADGDAH